MFQASLTLSFSRDSFPPSYSPVVLVLSVHGAHNPGRLGAEHPVSLQHLQGQVHGGRGRTVRDNLDLNLRFETLNFAQQDFTPSFTSALFFFS